MRFRSLLFFLALIVALTVLGASHENPWLPFDSMSATSFSTVS